MEAKKRPPFEQFVAFRRFGGVLEFTPDGEQVYFVSDISGQFNIWRVFVEGGWPSQLTGFVDRTVRSVAVSPADGTIAFCADQDGDEFHQVFLLDPNGGWPEQITDAPQVQHFVTPAAFSPDGAKLAYAANARTPTDMEVWVRDLATGETRPVFGEGCGTLTAAGAWSPDGSKLLAVELVSPTESSLHLVDLSTQRVEQVTASGEEAVNLPGPWKSDGSGFYLLSDEGREFKGIAFYRLADGSREWIETPEHDVEALASSADGRLLCWLVNEDGYERLDGRETESDTALGPCGLPAGARPFGAGSYPPVAVSADGSRLAVVLSSPRRPPEVYVVERATGGSSQVTENWIGGGLAEEQLVDAELIGYRSFDGREIPAWLYRPLDLDGRAPVVLSIHGGPQAQERPIYNPLHQYLVSRGIGCSRDEHPRLDRLRQDLPAADQPRLGRRRPPRLGTRRPLAPPAGLGRPGTDRRLRRLLRRLRRPELCDPAARLLGGRRRRVRSVEPDHAHPGHPADVAASGETDDRRPRRGRRVAARALTDDLHRKRQDAAARDPGCKGSPRRA